MGNDRDGGALLGLLVGGIIGAGLALLYAPRSGSETREQLREMAERSRERVRGLQTDAQTGRIVALADDIVEKARELVREGVDMADEKRGMIVAAIEAGRKALEEERARLEAQRQAAGEEPRS